MKRIITVAIVLLVLVLLATLAPQYTGHNQVATGTMEQNHAYQPISPLEAAVGMVPENLPPMSAEEQAILEQQIKLMEAAVSAMKMRIQIGKLCNSQGMLFDMQKQGCIPAPADQ